MFASVPLRWPVGPLLLSFAPLSQISSYATEQQTSLLKSAACSWLSKQIE